MTDEQFRQAEVLQEKIKRLDRLLDIIELPDSTMKIKLLYKTDSVNWFTEDIKENEIALIKPYVRDALRDNHNALSKIFKEL